MFTPYDWQESIGQRAQYIEGRLAKGVPVVALSRPEGIVAATLRRQTRKVYEVYDRLLFSALGQQSDVESLRIAALEFASREGYARSEADVTIQRVATGLSAPLKRAFMDLGSGPLVARCLFAEVAPVAEEDTYYLLDYDGDFRVLRGLAVAAGTEEQSEKLREAAEGWRQAETPEAAAGGMIDQIRAGLEEELEDTEPEAWLLDRSDARQNRFRELVIPNSDSSQE
jgi:proteasome alpha subunit